MREVSTTVINTSRIKNSSPYIFINVLFRKKMGSERAHLFVTIIVTIDNGYFDPEKFFGIALGLSPFFKIIK